jgi:hypothetical protein
LVESLENKKESGDWIDSLIVRESNAVYEPYLDDKKHG